MSATQPSLRERTRRAVQKEIANAAMRLFVDRGFETTTIDDIAAAAGMSRRSVFRYFATKEEIVVGKLNLGTEEMLATLRERPLDEPVWTSLRRVFDIAGEPDEQQALKPVQRMIFATAPLLAVYLERVQSMQDAVANTLGERAAEAGTPYTADDPTPQALAAAAFGCLNAAQHTWLASASDEPLTDFIDRAMAAVAPRA